MNLDHDFVQVSKVSEDPKKKALTKNGTPFSPNSGEDQKKSLHQKRNTFSPEFKRTPTLRCTQESNYWGGCRYTPHSTQTTHTAKLLGEIYPPRVSAMKGY